MANKKIGAPGMVFLPARDYKFEVSSDMHKLEIPLEGDFSDYFKDDDSSFKIVSDIEDSTLISFPAITKVLFACSKYPDLKDNEAFSPMLFSIKDNKLVIIGKVISFEGDVLK